MHLFRVSWRAACHALVERHVINALHNKNQRTNTSERHYLAIVARAPLKTEVFNRE